MYDTYAPLPTRPAAWAQALAYTAIPGVSHQASHNGTDTVEPVEPSVSQPRPSRAYFVVVVSQPGGIRYTMNTTAPPPLGLGSWASFSVDPLPNNSRLRQHPSAAPLLTPPDLQPS